MKRVWLCLALVAPVGSLWGCSSDDETPGPVDPGTPDAGSQQDAAPTPDAGDAGPARLGCGDASGAPRRALLVQGAVGGGELSVLNLETKAIDGRLQFAGSYGISSSVGTDPYLLDQEKDLVIRLDAKTPWKPVATWNVRGDDAVQDGDPNANPSAVVQTSCEKAYVLRYNRDKIAVIDPSQPTGGVPTKYIDLSALKQDGDPNMVEMTSAVYVPSKKRVYVLLGNTDFSRVVIEDGWAKLLCAPELKPSIIAIDIETDEIVDLGGAAPGGGIALEGYSPAFGPLTYDAAQDRLFVVQAGCNEPLPGGAAGDIIRRRVEQVDLATGAVKTLLSLDDRGFPSSFAFISGEKAALAFGFEGYHWDPRQTTLGAAIAGGVDFVASDGHGAYLGSLQAYGTDGTPGKLDILSIPAADGAAPTSIIEGPFSKSGGYVAGIEAWPQQ